MDISKAKEFILIDDFDLHKKLYASKDLLKIIEKNDDSLIGVYGVVDTDDGEVLMTTDWSYSGEPILMRRFLHKKFFRYDDIEYI